MFANLGSQPANEDNGNGNGDNSPSNLQTSEDLDPDDDEGTDSDAESESDDSSMGDRPSTPEEPDDYDSESDGPTVCMNVYTVESSLPKRGTHDSTGTEPWL